MGKRPSEKNLTNCFLSCITKKAFQKPGTEAGDFTAKGWDIMEKLTKKKQVSALALLLSLTYMVSYLTRVNYSAVIAEMELATGWTKTALSAALTGSFITYGAGQLISGFLGDRVSPKKLITWGLGATAAMNLLIPLCTGPGQMCAAWCINGLAQAFMWPPIMRIMTSLLSPEDYSRVSVQVSWGSSVGAIVIYLISPLIISLWSWKAVFLFCALCAVAALVVWATRRYEPLPPERPAPKTAPEKKPARLFSPLLLGIMAAVALQGILRDGVTTWVPSYLSETYHLSSTIAILTGVVLPLFSIVCFQLAAVLYRRLLRDPALCAGVLFGAGTVAALLLVVFQGKNAGLFVVFATLLTGCMHGVNLMLICMLPPLFAKHGRVSLVSGLLNSCTYVGSAISAYGIAALSHSFGWGSTLLSWLVVALLGTGACFFCAFAKRKAS